VKKSEYGDVLEIWGRYWSAYGGHKSLVKSPYLHVSLLLTLLSWHTWSEPGWWEHPKGALPDLLGFTLGGLAILLGLTEGRVVKALSFREDVSDAHSD